MGEYAKLKETGERIKIGTCEDMYYLRADQVHQVWPESGDVDPIRDASAIRFRFPFPNEDKVAPGAFENHAYAVAVHGVTAPEIDHGSVQFTASAGYLISLPCPESLDQLEFHGARIGRNGFRGAVLISQQRVWNGHLALVCQCGGCGAKYRCPELSDAADIVEALLAEAEQKRRSDRWWQEAAPGTHVDPGQFYVTIASRIVAGYQDPPQWVKSTCPSSLVEDK